MNTNVKSMREELWRDLEPFLGKDLLDEEVVRLADVKELLTAFAQPELSTALGSNGAETQEPIMTDRTWHKGPPPFRGWWNASSCADEDCWRWWNGMLWSFPAYPGYTEELVFMAMTGQPNDQKDIKWSDYYPKDARVPRIDPRKFQQSKE